MDSITTRLLCGWNDRWAALAATVRDPAAVGRIVRVDRGWCTIVGIGEAEIRARTPESVAVGDWVFVDAERDEVAQILSRTSSLSRAAADSRTEIQDLAANIDYVFILQSLTSPLNVRRLERELVVAWESGAQPVIVLTKADVVDADHANSTVELAHKTALGVDVLVVSNTTGQGFDTLAPFISTGKTIVMFGRSGVGKSSLINQLVGTEVAAIGEVRSIDDKGKHTTTATQLIVLASGGLLVDTPGIRALGLADAEGGLAAAFSDIDDLAELCRFRDCAHMAEPGCAVRTGIADGIVTQDRLDSYVRLSAELARSERDRTGWEAAAAHQAQRRFTKNIKGQKIRP